MRQGTWLLMRESRHAVVFAVRTLHLVVGGHEVVVAALDGHIAVRPARVLAPLPHVACRAKQFLMSAADFLQLVHSWHAVSKWS